MVKIAERRVCRYGTSRIIWLWWECDYGWSTVVYGQDIGMW